MAAADVPIVIEPAVPEPGTGITPLTTLILAAAGGIALANVYYVQPILELMARDLHVTDRTMGTIATMLQIGYALGVLGFVPLGDIVQRRPLIVGMFGLVTFFLVAVASAPNVLVLGIAILLLGITTTAPQILVPFAADLAEPRDRGRVIGTVQTGLIVGTLGARAVGGVIGAHFGWRVVFVFAAVVAALSTFALARVLPLRAPTVTLRYRDLLRTLPGFVARYPALRVSMGLGFVSFGTFSGLWTVFAFHARAIGYGADVVGYIGLVALIGAVMASSFGALSDRRGTLFTGTLGWFLTVVSYVVYLVYGNALAGLLVGSAVMAIGTQLTQISNLTRNFALDDSARSRINTIYMFTYFAGGALGSLVAAWAWEAGGWTIFCWTILAELAVMSLFLLWYRVLLARERDERG